MLARICSQLVWDQEEETLVNMETRLVAIEQLVEKLTNKMNILCEENQALKYYWPTC